MKESIFKFNSKGIFSAIVTIIIAIIIGMIAFMMKDKPETNNEPAETLTYVSEDGSWKISYDTSKYSLNDTLGNGEICFNYIAGSSGTNAVIISHHKDKMPDEVLYEKVKDIDDSRIERGECLFCQDTWAHFRHIKPENEDPEKGDVVYESFTAMEHNGGTVLFEFIGHLETNEEWYSNEINDESELLNTFELLNHQPQTEYAYIPGTYIREYTDEIGGDEVNIKESIILKDDHSCEMKLQDTVYGDWTGTKIEINWGDEYEYSVEGDSLYINMNDSWVEFKKSQNL